MYGVPDAPTGTEVDSRISQKVVVVAVTNHHAKHVDGCRLNGTVL